MSAAFQLLKVYALDWDVTDDLENLRRVTRLLDEMDAHFARVNSVELLADIEA
ncbi:MAG: hypothetical protein LYZ70_04450 [Nitrososphaerales archaeon]|nr:hypothetical protein [Nitrososphaerales archaeon]